MAGLGNEHKTAAILKDAAGGASEQLPTRAQLWVD